MNILVALIWIVLIVAVAGIVQTRIKHGRRHGGYRAVQDRTDAAPFQVRMDPVPSPREAELEREVEELRERVQVLEKIATDPARRTAEEIEKLRDD